MNMNFKMVILFILLTVMLISADFAVATSITDPTGDFLYPDISRVIATVDKGNLNIVITCTENIQDDDIAGAVFIDETF